MYIPTRDVFIILVGNKIVKKMFELIAKLFSKNVFVCCAIPDSRRKLFYSDETAPVLGNNISRVRLLYRIINGQSVSRSA